MTKCLVIIILMLGSQACTSVNGFSYSDYNDHDWYVTIYKVDGELAWVPIVEDKLIPPDQEYDLPIKSKVECQLGKKTRQNFRHIDCKSIRVILSCSDGKRMLPYFEIAAVDGGGYLLDVNCEKKGYLEEVKRKREND